MSKDLDSHLDSADLCALCGSIESTAEAAEIRREFLSGHHQGTPRSRLETWNVKLYSSAAMPTYVYETIPQTEGETPKRFEVRQSMKDAPFTHHPDNGTPVRRVPIGGTGLMGGGGSPAPQGGGGCGTGCGCH